MSETAQAETSMETKADNEPEKIDKNEEQVDSVVPKARLDKAVDEMMGYKKKVQELEDSLKTREMDDLKKREEWQEVARLKEEEAMESNAKAERIQKAYINEKKYSALKSEALKLGIRKEALNDLELIDFDDVGIETTSTGRINVLNADLAVQKLKTLRPHWFGAKGGKINSEDPSVVNGSKVTYEELFAAEKKARETGDYAPYEKMLKTYKNQ